MTAVNTTNGELLLIKIGDGGTPETFAVRCMINGDRGISLSAATVDSTIPDCSNPGLPAWVEREKDSLTVTIDGAGKLHLDDVQFFHNWLVSPNPKNCKISVPDGTKKWSGAFHCTAFDVTGQRKNKVEAKITLMSDGEVTYG